MRGRERESLASINRVREMNIRPDVSTLFIQYLTQKRHPSINFIHLLLYIPLLHSISLWKNREWLSHVERRSM